MRCAQGDVEGAAEDAARIVVVDSVTIIVPPLLSFVVILLCFFAIELSAAARCGAFGNAAKAGRRGCVGLQNAVFCAERAVFVVLQGADRSDSNRRDSVGRIHCEAEIRSQV